MSDEPCPNAGSFSYCDDCEQNVPAPPSDDVTLEDDVALVRDTEGIRTCLHGDGHTMALSAFDRILARLASAEATNRTTAEIVQTAHKMVNESQSRLAALEAKNKRKDAALRESQKAWEYEHGEVVRLTLIVAGTPPIEAPVTWTSSGDVPHAALTEKEQTDEQ